MPPFSSTELLKSGIDIAKQERVLKFVGLFAALSLVQTVLTSPVYSQQFLTPEQIGVTLLLVEFVVLFYIQRAAAEEIGFTDTLQPTNPKLLISMSLATLIIYLLFVTIGLIFLTIPGLYIGIKLLFVQMEVSINERDVKKAFSLTWNKYPAKDMVRISLKFVATLLILAPILIAASIAPVVAPQPMIFFIISPVVVGALQAFSVILLVQVFVWTVKDMPDTTTPNTEETA